MRKKTKINKRNDDVIDSYFQELQTSSYGNATSKSISNFKTSATNNHGYYIGRYEARAVTNNTDTVDEICNIYDMASNMLEWTTETCSDSNSPCVSRGGNYDVSDYYMSYRGSNSTTDSDDNLGFRPLLYL